MDGLDTMLLTFASDNAGPGRIRQLRRETATRCSVATAGGRRSEEGRMTIENLRAATAHLESGKSFDPAPRDTASPSICQVLVKNSPDQRPADDTDRESETSTNSHDDQGLEKFGWEAGSLCPRSQKPQ